MPRVATKRDVAEAERVREAIEKSFYLGGGRARVVLAERRDGIIVEVDAIADMDSVYLRIPVHVQIQLGLEERTDGK